MGTYHHNYMHNLMSSFRRGIMSINSSSHDSDRKQTPHLTFLSFFQKSNNFIIFFEKKIRNKYHVLRVFFFVFGAVLNIGWLVWNKNEFNRFLVIILFIYWINFA